MAMDDRKDLRGLLGMCRSPLLQFTEISPFQNDLRHHCPKWGQTSQNQPPSQPAHPRGRISQTPGISRSRVTLMVSQRSAKRAQAGDAPVMRGNSGRSAGTCFINSAHCRKPAGWEGAWIRVMTRTPAHSPSGRVASLPSPSPWSGRGSGRPARRGGLPGSRCR